MIFNHFEIKHLHCSNHQNHSNHSIKLKTMQNLSFTKGAGFLSAALVLLAFAVFFSASSSEAHDNTQTIKKLSAEVHALKAAQAEGILGAEPYLGEITMFAGNFAPKGWAFCNGQLLSIAQHTALFSILGTTYGGDGRTTFGLPDLRGRMPMGAGNGPGLSNRGLGQLDGTEFVAIALSTPTANAAPAVTKTQVVKSVTGVTAQNVKTLPPIQVVNFIIATQGIFPPRD
jgi:microcystin-dependent protein